MLRPRFTRQLAERLQAGASLIMVSPHGRGRRQTIRDLCTLLPSSLRLIHVNMRAYSSDYAGFLAEAERQAGFEPGAGPRSIMALLDALERPSRPTLLILHNFDEIRNSTAVAGGYGPPLFEALDSIARRQPVGLLCVCEQLRHHYLVDAEGNGIDGSDLHLQSIELPEALEVAAHNDT